MKIDRFTPPKAKFTILVDEDELEALYNFVNRLGPHDYLSKPATEVEQIKVGNETIDELIFRILEVEHERLGLAR